MASCSPPGEQPVPPLADSLVVVTGGSGLVGSGVVQAFLSQGATVVAPVRSWAGTDSGAWLAEASTTSHPGCPCPPETHTHCCLALRRSAAKPGRRTQPAGGAADACCGCEQRGRSGGAGSRTGTGAWRGGPCGVVPGRLVAERCVPNAGHRRQTPASRVYTSPELYCIAAAIALLRAMFSPKRMFHPHPSPSPYPQAC